ncbi:MAG: TetR/AcrR family transcriptional regulator, partial [Enterococcus sp.]
MQVKKEEMRLEILKAAESEFYIRGYRDASMRTISKKANTTLGNIYNYFENKDALFDAVIGHIPVAIENFISFHRSINTKNLSRYNYPTLLRDILPTAFPLDLMLSRPFIIFLEGSDGTQYEAIRLSLLKDFSDHICDHLQLQTDSTLGAAIF